MTQRMPTLDDALNTPLDVVSQEHVDGNPSGLEMIRLLRRRIKELEDAIEETLRNYEQKKKG